MYILNVLYHDFIFVQTLLYLCAIVILDDFTFGTIYNCHKIIHFFHVYIFNIEPLQGFPGGLGSEESACNTGDLCLIPGSERSPGEGNGYPLQYSCLKNSMNRGARWATVCVVVDSDMTKQLYWTLNLFELWKKSVRSFITNCA